MRIPRFTGRKDGIRKTDKKAILSLWLRRDRLERKHSSQRKVRGPDIEELYPGRSERKHMKGYAKAYVG